MTQTKVGEGHETEGQLAFGHHFRLTRDMLCASGGWPLVGKGWTVGTCGKKPYVFYMVVSIVMGVPKRSSMMGFSMNKPSILWVISPYGKAVHVLLLCRFAGGARLVLKRGDLQRSMTSFSMCLGKRYELHLPKGFCSCKTDQTILHSAGVKSTNLVEKKDTGVALRLHGWNQRSSITLMGDDKQPRWKTTAVFLFVNLHYPT